MSDPSSGGFDRDVSGQGLAKIVREEGGEYRAKNQVGGGERRPNEEYLEMSIVHVSCSKFCGAARVVEMD